ncbi:winged helix-turn-helix domain-containing protein [Phenylobacterium sp. LjRoot219]|uniref:winged helix-turn-helix domain-containing tetratricopeptide repeat protein n=1 Tax=Phenylobacterium sp. LjRoot219 TaxID=3342283 RepID=UPI003ECD56A2
MIYRFGRYSFDAENWELRAAGLVVPAEPQVLAVLRLLIENRGRLVSKDEVVDQVWKGRIVSDAAIASRIKSARQAVGDDGEAQAVIRTIPKLGFRFVAEVTVDGAPEAAPTVAPPAGEGRRRPSIAVLPFLALRPGGPEALVADALPHDLIAALSRLRWLFVIARGSSFRFRGPGVTAEDVGAALGVRYCLSGAVGFEAGRMSTTVELCDARSSQVIWAEAFAGRAGDVHEIRERIVAAVISALELEIPLAEARDARLSSPENLDAWSSYHLGLQQLYRFDREGTARAAVLFAQAIAREPEFARAYAGLSFAHFESAFLGFADDRPAAAAQAEQLAERAIAEDPLDPFCNLVRGRVHWLNAELDASLPWLERAIRLNPNYAQAKYSRGWAETLLGNGLKGRCSVDQALALSPLDPLAYGMLGVRAFSHLICDEIPEAAQWGERAARAPGAHALIEMIAAVAHTLNGDPARAAVWRDSARRRSPGLDRRAFLQAFPFHDPAALGRVSEALRRLGL